MTESAPSLTELAIKYSCDKYYAHSYISSGFYENVLSGRPVNRLLEIGIGFPEMMAPLVPKYCHGGSLRMWEEYLPEASIYACDIRPETLINEGRIYSVVCDQYSRQSLLSMMHEFGGEFDIIIDDGCHHPVAQIITFAALWPYLANGGQYVIEDVGYPELLEKAIDGETSIFRKDGRWDDVIVSKSK